MTSSEELVALIELNAELVITELLVVSSSDEALLVLEIPDDDDEIELDS